MGIKNAIIGAGFASLALGHTHKVKRGTIPVDGTIWTSCVDKSAIALTFDDGPFTYTQSIVDKLTAAGHRATFFQNGQNYDSIFNHNDTLKSMIAGGHQIASHTWSHADLATLTEAQIRDQMGQLDAAHQAIIGKSPTYMRPPYLSINALATTTLVSLGYKIVEVDIDTQDWAEGPIGQIQLSIDWFEGNQTAGGTMSLNHDPYQATADTFIPAIIQYLASKGLKSVTAGECLGDDPANWYRGGVTPPTSSSSSASTGPSATGNSTGPGKPTGSASGKPTGSASASGKPTGSPTGGHGSFPTGPSGGGNWDWNNGHRGQGKPICGGDTEPGHGVDTGRGSLPGKKGQGNYGQIPTPDNPTGAYGGGNGTKTGAGYGSGSGYGSGGSSYPGASGNKTGANPSYYTNGATGLVAGSAIAIGAAAFAFLL